ncbi:hypothetical protein BYT27DRAFT_7249814 [Phlegmacium glaucopus]|nr:hypothetical protein BYT27DRAFT_7249814 [Phlegmacium glaucopus]
MDANLPSEEKMPPIPLLHQFLGYLEKLRVVGDKFWKLGLRQVVFLRFFCQKRLFLLTGHFRNLNQISKSNGSRPSVTWDEANHDSHVFGDVDRISTPPSFLSNWKQRPQLLLPQHFPEKCYQPEPQTSPSTAQAVVSYSMTLMDDSESDTTLTSSSVTTRAEDDDLHSPPGLSKEYPSLVGVTSDEFERYERGFKSEKFYCKSFPIRPLLMTFKEPELPNQWVGFTHPDGAPYFLDDSRASTFQCSSASKKQR